MVLLTLNLFRIEILGDLEMTNYFFNWAALIQMFHQTRSLLQMSLIFIQLVIQLMFTVSRISSVFVLLGGSRQSKLRSRIFSTAGVEAVKTKFCKKSKLEFFFSQRWKMRSKVEVFSKNSKLGLLFITRRGLKK